MKKETVSTPNGYIISHRFIVTDGSGYDVMMKQDNQTHSFSFHSPWTYQERFPDVEELNNYSNIVNLLEQEFNIDFRK
ncbi:hypothetical protein [Pontibacter harenae]|uniref:hypothetical protein n=1 Tax=Pontibacter harenae TaxID=2894083 RepID=UPI001E34E499|nr:hypothetical protein [Pontibacter harenae]MCC9168680.1 hypothetical protein [Pontibacter harenae]